MPVRRKKNMYKKVLHLCFVLDIMEYSLVGSSIAFIEFIKFCNTITYFYCALFMVYILECKQQLRTMK